MNSPVVEDLKNPTHFQLLVELGHKDLAPFVNGYYWKKRSWITIFHYLISFVLLLAWIWAGVQQGYSFGDWIAGFGYAIITFIVLIPVHELIHGLVYRLAGAKDVRFNASLRQSYAYAVTHNFVANRRVFFWVAITPFLIINGLFALAAIIFPQYMFYMIGVILFHTAGTSGDFALLNYIWLNRGKELFTYDDADEGKSYFFARV